MNSKSVNSLKMLLSGLESRYASEPDFFISAAFCFLSGAREYNGGLAPDSSAGLTLTFAGVRQNVDFAGFCGLIASEAPKYDQLNLLYNEKSGVTSVTASNSSVKSSRSEQGDVSPDIPHANLPGRKYIIRADRARDLLMEIGILTKDGKIKNDMTRKYNQIDRFEELTAPYIDRLQCGRLEILDCGCGKSYLSFALNYYLREVAGRKCHVTGVDIMENVVENSRAAAARLRYGNMDFICADLNKFTPPDRADICISLHACDTATDLAIAAGVRAGARVIACVPCCHSELLDSIYIEPLAPLMRHGIIKARLNDVLSDALRIKKLEALGYEITVLEYVSPVDTPKNLLILAEKKKNGNPSAEAEYKNIINELRVYPALERLLNLD